MVYRHQFAHPNLSITTSTYYGNRSGFFLIKWEQGQQGTNVHEKDGTEIHGSSITKLLCDLK